MASKIYVSRAHLDRADEYLSDARSDAQSARGRSDSAFEAGYLTLLSVLTLPEREVPPEHPNVDVISLGSSRLGIDAAVGLRFLDNRYSAEGSETTAVVAWAESLRARVQTLLPGQS